MEVMFSPIDASIARLTEGYHGVFSRQQALDLGAHPDLIRSRVKAGLWVPIAPGVYTLRGFPRSPRSLLAAAVLETPGSVASHESAAELHGIGFVERGLRTITVRKGGNHRNQLAKVHETLYLPERVIARIDGINVTTRVQTVLHLSGVISLGRMARVLDDELSRKALSYKEICLAFYPWARRGRRGVARMRVLLDERGPGFVATDSELETRTLGLIRRHGLPDPDKQVSLPWREELEGRRDFVYLRQRVILEVDGRRWHGRDQAFEADRERDNAAILNGFRPFRFTWKMVNETPEYVVRVIREALAA